MRKHLFYITSLLFLAFPAHAKHIVVTTDCLVKNIFHEALATHKNLILGQLTDESFNDLLNEKDKSQIKCGGFIDVTPAFQQTKPQTQSERKKFLARYIPASKQLKLFDTYKIQHIPEVNALLAELQPENMWDNLAILSNYPTRYANASTGVQAANWIKTQIEDMASRYHRDDVEIYSVETEQSYRQPSIVMKIGNSKNDAIVLGAHLDTVHSYFSNRPGADDNGTGCVTLLETARTILSSPVRFNKPIYFIWYAAEEVGLVGSQSVVEHFKKENIGVSQVLNFDMTGYSTDDHLWLIDDYTDKQLTAFLADLINQYIKKPISYTHCGYACSDHATWTIQGYNAAIAFEAEVKQNKMNPFMHTSDDKMGLLSLKQMTDFLKLATAFVVELAEPQA